MGAAPSDRLPTGVAGLDEILYGGFLRGCTYLVRGGPGTGKTTLGLHFLTTGATKGEPVLFVGLSESEEQVRRNAASLGLNIDGVTFHDLSPSPDFFTQAQTYDIFFSAEVEREPVTQSIVQQVEELKPERVFIDAMSQFRYLAADVLQFRKQVLSFLRFLVSQGATVLYTSEATVTLPDDDLQFLSDGILHLALTPAGRTISVTKLRGSSYRDGVHSMRLDKGGMQVFPRLIPEMHVRESVLQIVPSGIPDLDELLHGGLEGGTVTVISGPSGTGKTTLGLQFMKEAAGRGERSVVYIFEEERDTLLRRSEAIQIPIHTMIDRGTLSVTKVEPLRFSPDEFVHLVRREVEEGDARIVMIDSISGYNLSMGGEDLVRHLHALCRYLNNMGVTVLLINEVEAITGDFRITEIGISFLADNVIFLKYLEIDGRITKAVGVLKKRMSAFEQGLRELKITQYGLKIGKPLNQLRGILGGTPEWIESTQGGDTP
jgi:circadian clock protein KaiC